LESCLGWEMKLQELMLKNPNPLRQLFQKSVDTEERRDKFTVSKII